MHILTGSPGGPDEPRAPSGPGNPCWKEDGNGHRLLQLSSRAFLLLLQVGRKVPEILSDPWLPAVQVHLATQEALLDPGDVCIRKQDRCQMNYPFLVHKMKHTETNAKCIKNVQTMLKEPNVQKNWLENESSAQQGFIWGG